jgi:hypothetical protein
MTEKNFAMKQDILRSGGRGPATDMKGRNLDYDEKTQTLRGATPKLPRQPYRDTVPAGRGSYRKPATRKPTRSGSRGGR